MAGESKPVVVVVDDEPAIRLLCKVNLELSGYEVREAATLADARTTVAGGDVAVVLLDMHVGNERSESLLAELRAQGVPVAVVTGSADLDSLRGVADAVLGKPFTITDLESVVAELTSRDG